MPSGRSRTSRSRSRSPTGDTIDDVVFGFVYDFGANEEWTAVRGGGAFLNGEPLTGRPKESIEFLSIEATSAALVLDRLAVLAPLTDRVRIMGAQAITFCHLAAGRTDAVVLPEAVADGRLRRRAAARSRARLRDRGDRRPSARHDSARPGGTLPDLRRRQRRAAAQIARALLA